MSKQLYKQKRNIMTIQDYNLFIKEIELFKDLSEDEIQKVSEIITEKVIPAKKRVFNENTNRKHIYMIHQGEIELFKKTAFGAEKKLSYFRKFDFLGEGSLIDNSPHSTNARTISETTLLVLS